ncbi:MAG: acetylornithine/succinylornithine family transaminase [Gammaproteobacteria bacterium]|nr:acetylornithine/succinylornithine family transaminase [Gammaproteobacteria bacterium]
MSVPPSNHQPVTVDPHAIQYGVSITRETHDQVMMPTYAPMQMIPARAKGSWLWDTTGKDYLDFAAGIAVSVLGHAHPDLVQVLNDQAQKFWHVSNLMTNEPAIRLAQRLCELTFAEKVFFGNSGGEANEAALKLARRYAFDNHNEKKTEIVAFYNGFHGRTFFTVSVGGQSKYSDGFGPKPGDITHLPFNDVDALRGLFEEKGDQICCVMLEPIQGEGGVNPASRDFVQAIRECCDQYSALMVLDEVQTGVGRSGKMYVYEKLGITPDILTTAKGLGGGFPIAAMLTTDNIAKSLAVGVHGSTFGGNPMACAVANKVLELVTAPGLLSDVERKSQLLVKKLMELGARCDLFSAVRGEGLLLGCELTDKWKDQAREILTACMNEGLMVLVAGPNVIRLAPPINISDEDLKEGIARMERAVEKLANH